MGQLIVISYESIRNSNNINFDAPPFFWSARKRRLLSIIQRGRKILETVRYVLMDKGEKKIPKDNSTEFSFTIESEIFRHIPNEHSIDTVRISEIDIDKIRNIEQLKEDEFKEHKKRTAQEGLHMPPPFKHYNLKVYILEKLCADKIIKYEVEWIFAIP